MPIYEFKCSECKIKFEDFVYKIQEQRVLSSCCNSVSRRTYRIYGHTVKMGGFDRVDRAQLRKGKKHGDLDEGVPFGQVPGDSDYTDSRGLKPGATDYLGPLP